MGGRVGGSLDKMNVSSLPRVQGSGMGSGRRLLITILPARPSHGVSIGMAAPRLVPLPQTGSYE